MWRNPKFFPDAGQATADAGPTPPEPSGRVLATFPRRSRGIEAELRIVLDEYEGHRFIGLRVWERSRSGWWPVKGKGLTIRVGELRGVVEALEDAIGQLERPPRTDGPPPAPRGGPTRPPGRAWQRDREPRPPRSQGPPDGEGL